MIPQAVTQRLTQCQQQLEAAVAEHAQVEQRLLALRTEIVGLQRAVAELEALTQQVVIALPESQEV